MRDSGFNSDTAVIVRRAADYMPGKDGPEHVGFAHMAFSAGGLYSTTEDLLRWEQGLFGGKLLSARSLAKMISPSSPPLDEGAWFKDGPYIKDNSYGLGVFVSSVNGHKFISHGGGVRYGLQSLRAYMAYFPDDHLTVVVLANLDNDNSVLRILFRLSALALDH